MTITLSPISSLRNLRNEDAMKNKLIALVINTRISIASSVSTSVSMLSYAASNNIVNDQNTGENKQKMD